MIKCSQQETRYMQRNKKNIINNCTTRPHMQMEVREEIFTLKAGDKRPHTNPPFTCGEK